MNPSLAVGAAGRGSRTDHLTLIDPASSSSRRRIEEPTSDVGWSPNGRHADSASSFTPKNKARCRRRSARPSECPQFVDKHHFVGGVVAAALPPEAAAPRCIQ